MPDLEMMHSGRIIKIRAHHMDLIAHREEKVN